MVLPCCIRLLTSGGAIPRLFLETKKASLMAAKAFFASWESVVYELLCGGATVGKSNLGFLYEH